MNKVNFLNSKKLANERGFSLIDVMVAMGLSAVAIVTTIGVISQAARVRKIENLRTSAIAVREMLIKNLARYDNFQETIYDSSNNGKFDCLKTTRQCGLTNMATWENKGWANGDLTGYLASNFNLMVADTVTTYAALAATPPKEIFYQASNLAEGFTDEGILCSQQTNPPTVQAPNEQCPIRADIYLWSLCAGTCNPGLVGIKVRIRTYNSMIAVPTKRETITPYGFRLIKSVYPNGQAGPFPVYP